MIMLGRGDMHWKGLSLYIGTKKQKITIEPVTEHPKMFRLRRPDGSLTDMTNLARAKDAAMIIVASIANSATKDGPESPTG